MDLKQFELLQESVQWVVDEAKRKKEGRPIEGRAHFQMEWAKGMLTGEQPKDHPYMEYVCPTACCLAGNGVLLAGDRLVIAHNELDSNALGQRVVVEHCLTAEGKLMEIDDRAQELFGLDENEALALFNGRNIWQIIVHRAWTIAKKHGYDLVIIE